MSNTVFFFFCILPVLFRAFRALHFNNQTKKETRNVTVCNKCPRRSLVRDTPSHYALSFCDVSLNLLQ